jgi:hypothetical protein
LPWALDEITRAIVFSGTKVGGVPQIVPGKRKVNRITKRYFFMIIPPPNVSRFVKI